MDVIYNGERLLEKNREEL